MNNPNPFPLEHPKLRSLSEAQMNTKQFFVYTEGDDRPHVIYAANKFDAQRAVEKAGHAVLFVREV